MSLQNRCHRQKKSHTDATERKCKRASKGDKEKEILQIVCVHFHADSLPKALEAAMAVLISNHLSHWSIPKRPREVYPKKFI